ncbi:hypothetical protein [Rahnella victoriana]|uniref:Uncharacterized protein n=1 Tax=Rahnella victoriana TaxID=1510570 RepID=A0ABS0DJV6_9GAMM|nr:hypothetical protein [Rahnella victoriana]MBF7954182.1 hypothetical protein [Rahnella victoriana]
MDNKRFQKLLLPKLTEAMLFTRSRLSLKSANKFYPDKRMIDGLMMSDPKKYRLHSLGGDRDRGAMVRGLRKLNLSSQQLYRKVEEDYRNGKENAGNCGENARVAFCYISENIQKWERLAGTPLKVLSIFISNPVDHCLVLVGTQPVRNNGRILENALICDPWAKIVCPLAHYSLEWKMKMNKWSNRGLKGKYPGGVYDHFANRDSREAIRIGKFVIYEQTQYRISQRIHDKKLYSLIDPNAIT